MNQPYSEFTVKAQGRWLESSLPKERRLAAPARRRITAKLVRCFHRLLGEMKPDTVLEIGAHQAEFSREIKERILPGARVVAFEANPEVHARHKEMVQAAGVEFRHQCVADENRTYRFDIPVRDGRNLSTMGSLLRDTGEKSFVTHEVEGVRLDDFLGDDEGTNAMWVDVEGAIGSVLDGARNSLGRCLAFYAEVETTSRWKDQRLDVDVIRQLAEYGLVPVLRDVYRRTWQYNILFIRESELLNPRVENLCSSFVRSVAARREAPTSTKTTPVPWWSAKAWRELSKKATAR